VRDSSLRSGPTREERGLLHRISELLAREEIMTKQRSKVLWIIEGDRNNHYFHSKANDRARNNKIMTLKKHDGSV
jgi:hypothetical protein